MRTCELVFAAPHKDIVVGTITLDGKKLTSLTTPGQGYELMMSKMLDKDLYVPNPEDPAEAMCVLARTDCCEIGILREPKKISSPAWNNTHVSLA